MFMPPTLKTKILVILSQQNTSQMTHKEDNNNVFGKHAYSFILKATV